MIGQLLDKLRQTPDSQRLIRHGETHATGAATLTTPFFIVGHPKSGTTWLNILLRNHPQIACRYEGHFFQRSDTRATLTGALADSQALREWMQQGHNGWSSDESADLDMFVGAIVRAYFEREAARSGKPIVGDKSPSYEVDQLHRLFPQARVLHIIRDGRDVAVSMAHHRCTPESLESGLGRRYMDLELDCELRERIARAESCGTALELPDAFVERMARTWVHEVRTCRDQGRSLFGKGYLEVRYEDLHASPHMIIARILTFLDAERSRELIELMLSKASFERLSGGRQRGQEDRASFFRKGVVGDSRNVLTPAQLDLFQSIAGDLLLELGYAPGASMTEGGV